MSISEQSGDQKQLSYSTLMLWFSLALFGYILEWLGLLADVPYGHIYMVSGMVLCGIGHAGYAKAMGCDLKWGLFALLPLIGPFAFGIVFSFVAGFKGAMEFALMFSIIGVFAYIVDVNLLMMKVKGRQAEARVNLLGISTSAIDLKERTKTFVIPNISQLGVEPHERSRYSLWYAVNGVPTMIPSANLIKGPCDVTTPPTTVQIAASATGFTAAAKGNIGGAMCDEWSINETKEMRNTLKGLSGEGEIIWERLLGRL